MSSVPEGYKARRSLQNAFFSSDLRVPLPNPAEIVYLVLESELEGAADTEEDAQDLRFLLPRKLRRHVAVAGLYSLADFERGGISPGIYAD